jgi:hypothetical protein
MGCFGSLQGKKSPFQAIFGGFMREAQQTARAISPMLPLKSASSVFLLSSMTRLLPLVIAWDPLRTLRVISYHKQGKAQLPTHRVVHPGPVS